MMGLLGEGNAVVLVMVKLEARRIVALGSPSVLALFSAARSSALLLTRYSAADAPRGKSSAMANAMGDACGTHTLEFGVPRVK